MIHLQFHFWTVIAQFKDCRCSNSLLVVLILILFSLSFFFEKVIITFRLIMMQPFPVSLQYKSLSIVYINQIIAKLHILLSKWRQEMKYKNFLCMKFSKYTIITHKLTSNNKRSQTNYVFRCIWIWFHFHSSFNCYLLLLTRYYSFPQVINIFFSPGNKK